jgi:folate-binding Fe-S cluster repair protein YgfZ
MNDERVHDEYEPFSWSVILVRGPAAESFLQGQLSQDVANVTNAGEWSLLLEPNSDVLCTCFVQPVPGGYSLLVARASGEAALTRLKRFHLRVDCALELLDAESGPFSTLGEQIDRGEPGPSEFVGLSPQSYGPAFVASHVSFVKGCFTGQELVARMDARGSSVPWRFVRASGPSLEAIDAVLKVKGPEGASGVTSAVRRGGGVVALGFIHRSALELSTSSKDVAVTVID